LRWVNWILIDCLSHQCPNEIKHIARFTICLNPDFLIPRLTIEWALRDEYEERIPSAISGRKEYKRVHPTQLAYVILTALAKPMQPNDQRESLVTIFGHE
jgi:hypothetical protein